MEQWKDIPGYEQSYQVSDKGRVRSLSRIVQYADGRRKFVRGCVLRPAKAGRTRNYSIVQLSQNNEPKVKYIHDLVLLAFIGPKPCGLEACHGPRGQRDNSVTNLRYGTPSQNQKDRRRDGTGNNKPVRRSDGKKYDSIGEAAREMGIARSSISHAVNVPQKQVAGFTWERV